ncbi:MAG: DoxX family protein [Salinibacter sp.]
MKYLYWGTTALLALMMAGSGTMYFVAENASQTFAELGFPDYFRIELGIAKLLGAAALVLPLPRSVKEWTYAGFGISFISAIIAHLAVGDPVADVVPPIVASALLVTSYVTYHTYRRAPAAPVPETEG